MVIIVLLLIVVIAGYLLFRKKDKAVGSPSRNPGQNFTALLQEHVAYYRNLDKPGKIRFETLIGDFLTDTTIEGVGTAVTDIDRVLIASSAVIPIFGFPEWRYRNLTNVILYPDTFDKDFQFEGDERNILGMVGTGYMNGQMILSRAALTKGFSASAGKENAAIHEFVHLLDKSDGETDGVPENLLAHQYTVPWLHMIHQEMHRIQAGTSDINPYGLTNEAEFFAVASEYFFEKPQELHKKHPALYELLGLAFGQQPA